MEEIIQNHKRDDISLASSVEMPQTEIWKVQVAFTQTIA
jgi:hypothetical protein